MANIPSKVANLVSEKYVKENNTFKRVQKDNPKDRIEVEIGDAKQPDFKPQRKSTRWNNEVNFSQRAPETENAVVRTEGETIKYIAGDYEVHQYEKPDAGEDGGYELEMHFKTLEALQQIATVQGDWYRIVLSTQHKCIVGYKQLPLNQEITPGEGETVTETQHIDKDGNVIAERPEEYVNSIAFYHESKGGLNRSDGMEYKTGKFGYAPRIKLIGADGSWTWGDQNWIKENEEHEVLLPKEWVDNYDFSSGELIVDPTFGYTTVGGSNDSLGGNYFRGSLFTCPENLSVDSLTAYISYNGKSFAPVIYNGVTAVTNSKGPTITGGSSASWQTSTYVTKPTLTGSSAYTIGLTVEYYLSKFYYDTDASNPGREDNTNYYPTPHDDAGSFTTTNKKRSIYATYTASSSGTDTNDERSAELTGHIDTNSTRDAELTGKDATNSERSASVTGEDSTNSTRQAETTGHETSNDERSAQLIGNQSTNDERGAEVLGGYVTPQYLYWSQLNDNSNTITSVIVYETEVTTPSDSSIDWHASPDGGSTWESITAGTEHTFTAVGQDLRVRATLNASSDLQESPTLTTVSIIWTEYVSNDTSSNRSAELTGEDSAYSTRSAVVTGYSSSNSSRNAQITGYITTNNSRNAEITGAGGTASNRSAELTGYATTNDTRNAELTGSSASNSERSAEITGYGTGANDERNAEITGEILSDKNNQKLINTGSLIIPLGWRGMSYWNTSSRPSGVQPGTYGLNVTTNNVEIYNGSAWRIFIQTSEIV